jgi:hypothetical protein
MAACKAYHNDRLRTGEKPRAEGPGSVAPSIVVVERESDFESDLVMRHRAVFDMAARLHHLKPADLPQRARRAANGVLNRVLDALFRGACNLDDPVNVIWHRHLLRRDPATQGSVRQLENTCALTFVLLELAAIGEVSRDPDGKS